MLSGAKGAPLNAVERTSAQARISRRNKGQRLLRRLTLAGAAAITGSAFGAPHSADPAQLHCVMCMNDYKKGKPICQILAALCGHL